MEQETDGLANGGDDESGECRTDEASAVHQQRIECDRIRQVIRIVHQLNRNRLSSRNVQGIDAAQE